MPRNPSGLREELDGRLSIGYTSGGGEDSVMRLTIEDQLSHTIAVEATIDLLTWAKALASQGYLPIKYSLNRIYPGLTREHKQEMVWLTTPAGGWNHRYGIGSGGPSIYEQASAELAPYEVDGWSVFAEGIGNGHLRRDNRDGNPYREGRELYELSFERWLYPDGTPFLHKLDGDAAQS